MIRPEGTALTPEVIRDCIIEHQRDVLRLAGLKKQYIGGRDSFKKQRANPTAPNNIVIAPYPYYIVTIANGFTFANPVTYKGNNISNLLEEYKKAKVAAHDAELGEDLSIYGKAYELAHMSKLPTQHVKLNNLPPEGTFVVFSDSIDPEPMFAVYYHPKTDASGKLTEFEINAYDNYFLTVYRTEKLSDIPVMSKPPVPHFAGQVPIVEYKNNDEGIGDFERVDTLIEAYNRLQSDRLDDKDQFIDALLLVYGAALSEDSDKLPEVIRTLKTYKIIDGLPESARAEYLRNALDETSVETLRQALKQDISKFSLVPELTDESFAGNVTGVAMEYKTLGLKWLANMKRRMFKKSLDRRLQIMNSYMSKMGRGFDWTDVDVIFSDALPVDQVSLMPYAKEVLSNRTMISALANPFGVIDVDKEQKQVEAEKDAVVKRDTKYMSGGNQFGSDGE